MPSKRKKNKRRMRRVQAQRLALEEQNAANHPVKASPGIAVSAPPLATPKKPAKTIAPVPVKIPQAVPIAVPIVETPKVDPNLVVEPIPANVEAPKPEPLSHAETEIEARVGDEVEGQAPREVPVVETPPVELPTVKAAAEQETKCILPATEPAIEAVPPAEAPVVATNEKEIQIVDTLVKKTETELMNDVCEPEPKLEPKLEPKPEPKPELEPESEPESEPKLEPEAETTAAEDVVIEVQVEMTTTEEISVPVMGTTEEPGVEELSIDQVCAEAEPFAGSVVTETVVESVTEAATEIPESAQLIKEFSPAVPTVEEEDEGEVKVSDEEDPAADLAEPVTTEKESDSIPDDGVKEAKAAVAEEKEAEAGVPLEDFVVTESVSAVEVAISASAAVQQEIVTTMETFSTQMKSMDVALSDPAAAAPAKDVIIEAAEAAGLEMLSEEPKAGISDMPCQTQIPAEPVQLSSAEISMETALNGHIVPEVSIEG